MRAYFLRIAAFVGLFHLGMSMSKALHPLYWRSEGGLAQFSLAYSVMAFAGCLSVFLPSLLVRLGTAGSAMAGTAMYAAGIGLRAAQPSYPISIVSGLLGGVGASIVLLATKNWTLATPADRRPRLISLMAGMSGAAQSAGLLAAGWATAAFGYLGLPDLPGGLLLAAAIPVLALAVMPPDVGTPLSGSPKPARVDVRELMRRHAVVVIPTTIALFVLGLYGAALLPMLPLYLEDAGWSVQALSTLMAAAMAAGIGLNLAIGQRLKSASAPIGYMLVCCVSAASVIGFMYCRNAALAAVAAGVYVMLRPTSSALFENVQFQIVDDASAPAMFGLLQSTFLLADIVGGLVAPAIFAMRQHALVPCSVAVLIVVNGLVFLWIARASRARLRKADHRALHLPAAKAAASDFLPSSGHE